MCTDLRNRILWEDAHLLAVNKPAGLRTLPDGYDQTTPHLKSLLEPLFGRLWIVHRLDKDTSGIILLARTAEAHRALNTQFEQHQVSKVYHALVIGNPEWEGNRVNLPLRPNGDRRHRTVVDQQGGKPSETTLRVLERFGAYTLLEALPKTGRPHQIRAHLLASGFPIAGDDLYRGKTAAQHPLPIARLTRPVLHARRVEFTHPYSQERCCLQAPYPDDLAALLEALRHPPSSG